MGKKVLVFLLLLSFIGWTKAQQEELQNGTEQSKQLQVFGRNIFASRNLSFEPNLTYIIHSGFISGYQNRYGDNLKPPTNVYHRMTA